VGAHFWLPIDSTCCLIIMVNSHVDINDQMTWQCYAFLFHSILVLTERSRRLCSYWVLLYMLVLREHCGRKSLVLSGKTSSRNKEIMIPDLRKKPMKRWSEVFLQGWIQGALFFPPSFFFLYLFFPLFFFSFVSQKHREGV